MLSQNQKTQAQVIDAIKSASLLMFDVDGTLAKRQQPISPDLAIDLARTDKRLGVATSRANSELDEVFDGSNFTRSLLMQGPIILEDGGLIVYPGEVTPRLMVTPEEHQAVSQLMELVLANLTEIGASKWQRLGDIIDPLVHVPCYYDYQVSASIWQEVKDGIPRNLERVMGWCLKAVSELNLSGLLDLTEIGDGTLRISVPGRSKGVALIELDSEGIIDLQSTAYFGDGRNDLPAAKAVREKGGVVIAVDQQCQELLELANFVTEERGPDAIRQLIHAAGLV